MTSLVCSGRSIDFELHNQGRILILKDALYNPSTQKYHDIQLERSGWKFLGFDLGGAGKFTGITSDVVREVQSTYGIALKTLQAEPSSSAFWTENGRKTFYTLGPSDSVRTSYPYGKAAKDLHLSPENASHYGAEKMTLHDAMNAGIWSAIGWSEKPAFGSAAKGAALAAASIPGTSQESQGALRSPPRMRTHKQPQVMRSFEEPADSTRAQALSGEHKDSDPLQESKEKDSEIAESQDLDSKRQDSDAVDVEKGKAPSDNLDQKPVVQLPRVPAYRSGSTPFEPGYDLAPFEERKRRIIRHLDSSSPIPFSAFVDCNRSQKIDPYLYLRMLDALRRLAANPKENGKDAEYMRGLFQHWFRAGYHYLNQNSKPGDGYQQTLSQVAEKIKDPLKAEAKAKELYWRRHATDFWMTFVDLFAKEKIDIDLLRKFFATETSLNSWF